MLEIELLLLLAVALMEHSIVNNSLAMPVIQNASLALEIVQIVVLVRVIENRFLQLVIALMVFSMMVSVQSASNAILLALNANLLRRIA